jgi:hypothetical protein
MIPFEDLEALLSNPHTDNLGNTYWEWPDKTGHHTVRVCLMGPDEHVCTGVWDVDTPMHERPLHLEITSLSGRVAAVALIKRWRHSGEDERFVHTVRATGRPHTEALEALHGWSGHSESSPARLENVHGDPPPLEPGRISGYSADLVIYDDVPLFEGEGSG